MAYLTVFDSRQLRRVLGSFTTGVTVVTTKDAEGSIYGVTANSFSSVSLDPPLILWSQALNSKRLHAFQTSEFFTVNILAHDQIDISTRFARSGEDPFDGLPYFSGANGVPVLHGIVAHFDCRKVAEYLAGDHVIYIGRVEGIGYSGARPLNFARGTYAVSLSHELDRLRNAATASVSQFQSFLRPITDALPILSERAGGRPVELAVWGNHGPTVIASYANTPTSDFNSRPGTVLSATETSIGRIFSAFLNPRSTRAFIDHDLRLHRASDEEEQVQRAQFENEIALIKANGFDVTHRPSYSTLSLPVFDHSGELTVVLSAFLLVSGAGSALLADVAGKLGKAMSDLSLGYIKVRPSQTGDD